jgi:hypothetical protein
MHAKADEPVRVWPNLIHHQQYKYDGNDEAPEQERPIVFQVHEVKKRNAGFDEREKQEHSQQRVRGEAPIREEHLDAHDAQQARPYPYARGHAQALRFIHVSRSFEWLVAP